MFSKEKLSWIGAEFIGTVMLSSIVLVVSHMFGLGTAAWYTSLSAGIGLALIIAVFGHVTGAHVNPAVTIGLWTTKRIQTANAIVFIAAQMLGGVAALYLYNYLTGDKLMASGSSEMVWRVFWAEAIGAAVFGMGIAAALVQKLEGYYTSFAIGLSLTFGALIASTGAAGFLNPAVALANNAWDKTYALAPIVGMVVGMNLYMALFTPATKKSKK